MSPSEPGTAYVLKMYPRFSETFIVSEILAREAAGDRLEIFSLLPPNDPRFHSELARVRAPVTYIDRPLKTADLWESFHAAEAAGLTAALGRNFAELAAAAPEDAVRAINLAVALQHRNIRHMHVHFASGATTVARLASAITGIPFSFTAHAVDIFHESVSGEDLRIKFEQAHHAVTISRFNLRYLRRQFPAATGRLHLVRNGLDLDRFPYRDPRPPGAVVRIAAVGRLVEKKGFQYLLPAAAELLEAGVHLDLRIAGTGVLAEELEETVGRLGLGGHVRLIGAQTQDQVQELLESSDIFVAPCVVAADGNADGMPTVLLEAMASGVPCISTAVTGIPEVVRNGSTGILARPGNSRLLARAIEKMSAPGTDRVLMARNARALIEEDFDVRRQAELLRSLSLAARRVA
ncbi:colanic acid biosynthesis glycosyltransferase WcaL [Arthrobacter sp. UKPF54-2]|uniref:glycosyltransferase n=1 Tax=Arthrobacter sp. UKPF54-2 TaxID=2600159 RepID=UPI0011B1B8BE|nr:glycosyltransferase [Arthrobacter sp. UKPF54-2]QDY89998.1 colanic acid biosynthesis glycosyltransferase WcaL [Arthrobacter sp. UKPF54-2]